MGVKHLSTEELDAGLDEVRRSPADDGTVELIVRRPAVDEREVLDEGELDCSVGLVGDTWPERISSRIGDGPHPDCQITLMNARAARLVAAGDDERRALAGDQLFVDINLGYDNIPPGTLLEVGAAVVQVTEPLHTGCHKFAARFGQDVVRFVNSPAGRELNLRGVNAKVVVAGTVRPGDAVRKRPSA